jgi:hypothetical protein
LLLLRAVKLLQGTIVTRKSAQLSTLVLVSCEKIIQARHGNVVKVIVKFIRKRVHF